MPAVLGYLPDRGLCIRACHLEIGKRSGNLLRLGLQPNDILPAKEIWHESIRTFPTRKEFAPLKRNLCPSGPTAAGLTEQNMRRAAVHTHTTLSGKEACDKRINEIFRRDPHVQKKQKPYRRQRGPYTNPIPARHHFTGRKKPPVFACWMKRLQPVRRLPMVVAKASVRFAALLSDRKRYAGAVSSGHGSFVALRPRAPGVFGSNRSALRIGRHYVVHGQLYSRCGRYEPRLLTWSGSIKR